MAVVFACLLGGAQAFDYAALKPQGYVSDFSKVLDAASRSQLEQYCARVEQLTGAQMALVTIPTLEGEPIEDVANSLFRKWGIGKKGQDNGILLLLVTNDRRMRLEVGYGLEPIIPDGFAGDVLREMRPALRSSQYGEAMLAAAQVIGSRIASAKGVNIDQPLQRRISHRESTNPAPFVFGVLFLLFLLSIAARGRGAGGCLNALLLGNLLGGGGFGGSSGGGFGGGDSGGGGFGGFGGGDSGGGGASGSW
jgi:uncharacterized protein